MLAQRDFDGVTYQIVENIDANVKLTQRRWLLRKGDQEMLSIHGYDLFIAGIPERLDVPYVKVKQAFGSSLSPSLLLLPKEKFQEQELPRIAELFSDPSAWKSRPDAVDIEIGGLLLGDGSDYLLRYDGSEKQLSLFVDVYGVVTLRKPDGDGANVFVGWVAKGGKNVPVASSDLHALKQAEPGGLPSLADYQNSAGEKFGSRFALIPQE